MNFKKISSLILFLLLVVSNSYSIFAEENFDKKKYNEDGVAYYRIIEDEEVPRALPNNYIESNNKKVKLSSTAKYISGYNNTIRPNDFITRGEVAQIIFNLSLDPNKENIKIITNISDLDNKKWYSKSISYLIEKNLISGYEDNTIKPEEFLTRAEAVKLLSNFVEYDNFVGTNFKDIKNHWCEKDILNFATQEYLSGYSDGNFKPNNLITRGEIISLINRILEAVPREDFYTEKDNKFTDLNKNHWAFSNIISATN